MSTRCAVCGQTLPVGVTEAEMHRRLEKIGSTATEREVNNARREMDQRYRLQLTQQAESIRRRAAKDAAAVARRQVAEIQRQLDAAEGATRRAVAKAVADATKASRGEFSTLQRKLQVVEGQSQQLAERAAKQAAKDAAKLGRKELDLVKERAARERAQHAADNGRLKARVDELSLKLERQTSEQMGEMAEADALSALRAAFPHDDIQRIGRGVRGADILQKVMVDGGEVGRVVYECKNVTSWQNEWLTKARTYRSEYQTPWVVIASRCFPRREKWFCVEKNVPVIHLRLIVRLAEVIRAAVVEIGSLRVSADGRKAKAEQIYSYVLGDHFVGRFNGIAEAVTALRDQQGKDRQWHNEAWAKQTRLYDEVDGGRREIAAQVRAIVEAPSRKGLRVVSGSG
jgi:hypothetical protein